MKETDSERLDPFRGKTRAQRADRAAGGLVAPGDRVGSGCGENPLRKGIPNARSRSDRIISENPTYVRFATGESNRCVSPRMRFGSSNTSGTPSTAAASETGPAA